ncbi:hypothetical protein ACFW17_21940 [Streptomyces sp. NPDC058961]|uniref:hypothetical protein n=1 Tax=Streptomyces sp. NPDC058961 TaxID=3346680 RepID=UPI0036954F5D
MEIDSDVVAAVAWWAAIAAGLGLLGASVSHDIERPNTALAAVSAPDTPPAEDPAAV